MLKEFRPYLNTTDIAKDFLSLNKEPDILRRVLFHDEVQLPIKNSLN